MEGHRWAAGRQLDWRKLIVGIVTCKGLVAVHVGAGQIDCF